MVKPLNAFQFCCFASLFFEQQFGVQSQLCFVATLSPIASSVQFSVLYFRYAIQLCYYAVQPCCYAGLKCCCCANPRGYSWTWEGWKQKLTPFEDGRGFGFFVIICSPWNLWNPNGKWRKYFFACQIVWLYVFVLLPQNHVCLTDVAAVGIKKYVIATSTAFTRWPERRSSNLPQSFNLGYASSNSVITSAESESDLLFSQSCLSRYFPLISVFRTNLMCLGKAVKLVGPRFAFPKPLTCGCVQDSFSTLSRIPAYTSTTRPLILGSGLESTKNAMKIRSRSSSPLFWWTGRLSCTSTWWGAGNTWIRRPSSSPMGDSTTTVIT